MQQERLTKFELLLAGCLLELAHTDEASSSEAEENFSSSAHSSEDHESAYSQGSVESSYEPLPSSPESSAPSSPKPLTTSVSSESDSTYAHVDVKPEPPLSPKRKCNDDTQTKKRKTASKKSTVDAEGRSDNHYYKHYRPGVIPTKGAWSLEETDLFLRELKNKQDETWGTFSKRIPGRNGEQCNGYYRYLLRNRKIEPLPSRRRSKSQLESLYVSHATTTPSSPTKTTIVSTTPQSTSYPVVHPSSSEWTSSEAYYPPVSHNAHSNWRPKIELPPPVPTNFMYPSLSSQMTAFGRHLPARPSLPTI
eukprot:TRINITY_DN56426_c0_g1_i2.p1 TRINITY_DN56426_c0_g1~~TRINITY_DN56426_c0_g1_i2.p1  ORF type:complete len:320 (-),score=-22.31 TRINITY_DN56426_c0_g1_i2:176-1096(-)